MKNILITITVSALSIFNANAQIITTVAGNGSTTYTGDGGPATLASLYAPFGVAADLSGNIYITDSKNHCIRKVDVAGTITTITGNGIAGYSGDGGPASDAQINLPTKVTIDASGNVYFIDNGNHRIRRIGLDGIITTIAGTGVADNTGDGGPATDAAMYASSGLALDRFGSIYFGDLTKHTIRKINPSGIISTIAGTGISGYSYDGIPATDAKLNQPFGIDVDDFGNIYVAEYMNNCIRKIDALGMISTLTGYITTGYSGDGGPATAAKLNRPYDVAVAHDGSIFIADESNYAIRKIAPNGIISRVAGTAVMGYSGDGGPATNARISSTTDVALDNFGNLLFTEASGGNRIRKVEGLVSVSNNTLTTNDISIFPNPCCSITTLFCSSPINQKVTIAIFDSYGREVKNLIASTNSNIILESNFPAGTYIVQVVSPSFSASRLLFVQRN